MPRRRSGFTLTELLVVLGIIVVLIGLILPAVQKFRATSDSMETANNMKNVGMATVNYAQKSRSKKLPSALMFAFTDPTRPVGDQKVYHTMFVALLPYLEEKNVADIAFDVTRYKTVPWQRTVIKTYSSPEDQFAPDGISNQGLGVANYAANAQLFMDLTQPLDQQQLPMVKGSRKLNEIRDGQSNTLMYATKYGNCGSGGSNWAVPNVRGAYFDTSKGAASTVTFGPFFGQILPTAGGGTFQFAPNEANCNPDIPQSFTTSSIAVCMADASVKRLNQNVSGGLWQNVLLPADGQPTGLDW